MVYCKKVVYDNGNGKDKPAIILGKVETIREGDTVIKKVTTGKGKEYRIRADLIFRIDDTSELFKQE
jgi:hypothetical protein